MKNLERMILQYIPYDEEEAGVKILMLQYLSQFGEMALTRECASGHFTTSVFLFNKEHTKVLMCYHLIDDSWAFLGGHADGIADLKSVALREVQEEAGIKNYHLINDGKVALLSCNPIGNHVKNGKYIPSHVHLDVIFVGEADETEELIIKPDENDGLKWIDVKELKAEVADKWKMEHVYQAAMMDPHTGGELSTDEIVALCDELKKVTEEAGYPVF